MDSSQVIGKVSATERKPTTCTRVRFWVKEGAIIRPFDVVRIHHMPRLQGTDRSYTYAIIQDLQYITDSASDLAGYVSSDFGDVISPPQNYRLGTTVAEAEVLFNDQEVEMPVREGATVEWADVKGIRQALGIEGLRDPVPAGYMQMSDGSEVPVEVDARYLLGPEGAHLNISGISGLATKTSYAMFLLNSLQQRLGDKVTIIIFNVKGADLLSIDEENPDLTEEQRRDWLKCNLEPQPFQDVTYLYPYANRPKANYTCSHACPDRILKQQQEGRAANYFYDVDVGKRKLPLLFSDIDDPQSTMDSIIHELLDQEVDSWSSLRDYAKTRSQKGSPTAIPVVSWRRFKRLLETRTSHDLFTERSVKPDRRQVRIRDALKQLKRGQVVVIDIEPLPDYVQCLVVGDVIQTIYSAKLGDEEDIDGANLGTVIIFADELNKYAPRTSEGRTRTLTDSLREISERGRSLGVVLFSAEQFRSGVDDRVLGNCSTNVFGRTNPVEVAKCPDYRYFPDSYKAAVTRLPQGHLLLQHAVFKTALVRVRFPFPAYYQPKGEI